MPSTGSLKPPKSACRKDCPCLNLGAAAAELLPALLAAGLWEAAVALARRAGLGFPGW